MKKITNLKKLEKFLKTGISYRPCIINLRNFKSLINIISTKVSNDYNNTFILYLTDFIKMFYDSCNELFDKFKIILIFSCDKFDESDSFDNEIKNLVDFFWSMPKFDEKNKKFMLNNIFQHLLNYDINNSDDLDEFLRFFNINFFNSN